MALTPDEEEYLKSIYFDPAESSAFAGPDKLYKRVAREGWHRISQKIVANLVDKQYCYSLQRQARYKFYRRRVIMSGIDLQWDMHLVDVCNISKYNDECNFMLFVIDLFSRYL